MLEPIENHARPTRETSAGKPMPRGTRFPARGLGVSPMPEYVNELKAQNTKFRNTPRAAEPQPNGNGFNRKERIKRKEAVPLSLRFFARSAVKMSSDWGGFEKMHAGKQPFDPL